MPTCTFYANVWERNGIKLDTELKVYNAVVLPTLCMHVRPGQYVYQRHAKRLNHFHLSCLRKKVQVGKDQEKAQSEKDSHSKNRGGKKLNLQLPGTYTMKTYRKPNEQLFSQSVT